MGLLQVVFTGGVIGPDVVSFTDWLLGSVQLSINQFWSNNDWTNQWMALIWHSWLTNQYLAGLMAFWWFSILRGFHQPQCGAVRATWLGLVTAAHRASGDDGWKLQSKSITVFIWEETRIPMYSNGFQVWFHWNIQWNIQWFPNNSNVFGDLSRIAPQAILCCGDCRSSFVLVDACIDLLGTAAHEAPPDGSVITYYHRDIR